MQNPRTDAESGRVATIPNKDIPIPTLEIDSDPDSDSESSDKKDKKKEPTKEAEEAIDRILQKDSDLWEILGVEPGSQKEIKTVNAFKQLGCLVHPDYVKGEKTKKAFKRLMKHAKSEIHPTAINQVKFWDGEDTLIEEDDSMEVDAQQPPPPEHILKIYKEATPAVKLLQSDVRNKDALDFISIEMNNKIKQQNKELGSEPDKALEEIKRALDALAEKSYYPKLWSLPDNFREIARQAKETAEAEAEAARKTAEAEVKAAKQRAKAEKNKAVAKASSAKGQPAAIEKGVRVEYPWETMKTQHGELIIGIRRRGIGHQVCVEVEQPDGRIVRTLKSGSEAGLRDTAKYKSIGGHKSIYRNSRNPSADYCMRFLTKGIQILSVLSFEKVLGHKDAREEIIKVCERDGICAPWAVEMITEDNDPKGGKWRKKQSKLPSSKANEIEKESRVDGLERKLVNMTKKMDSLVQLMAKLLEDRPEGEEQL
ncbi:hypothetical protein V8F33_011946 [Rhypophila sp. PSN 637]